MKVIEGLCYAFDVQSIPPKIHKFLREKKAEKGAEFFVDTMLYWFGGRGYNEFLDYGLLALKLAHFFSNFNLPNELDFHEEISEGIILELLFDDRHDMYQNVPYVIDRICELLTEEQKQSLLANLSEFIVQCFNPDGGDKAWKTTHEERLY